MTTPLTFRNADINDLTKIVAIYNSTIASRLVTADTEEVTLESKLNWFYAHNTETRPLWVVLNQDNFIVGWVSFQSFYGRPAYDKTAEISIYLHEDFRGKGLGKLILAYAIKKAPNHNIDTLLGFIFSHNLPSIKLFESLGFVSWAHLPDIAILDNKKRSLSILGLKV